mmetsp:Transcript_105846/g.338029  ORF Transcript_105846/g.338029 Transcript_105846/m.338029 type:complete len:92 (+) Transcript_105846:439-714(+)
MRCLTWVIRSSSERCRQQPEQPEVFANAVTAPGGQCRHCEAHQVGELERAVTSSRRRESKHEERQTKFLESVIEVIAECVCGRRACPRERG